jgi:signal transduction histidine kinase
MTATMVAGRKVETSTDAALPVPLFASNEVVAALEARIHNAGDHAALSDLVDLAWQRRQRDPDRACQMTEALQERLNLQGDGPESQRASARLALVRVDVMARRASCEAALPLWQEALAAFEALQDPIGIGDAHFVAIGLWRNLGNAALSDQAPSLALSAYLKSGDVTRQWAARAVEIIDLLFAYPKQGQTELDALLRQEGPRPGIYAQALVAQCRHLVATMLGGSSAECLRLGQQSVDDALGCGALETAATHATALAEFFRGIGDTHLSLDWAQKALHWAETSQSVLAQAMAMGEIANSLLQLGQRVEAKDWRGRALKLLAALPHSTMACELLNDAASQAELEGDHDQALTWFSQAVQMPERVRLLENVFRSCNGLACVHGRLGDKDQALGWAEEALSLAQDQGNPRWALTAMCTLAELPVAGGSSDPLARAQALQGFDRAHAYANETAQGLPPPFLQWAAGLQAQEGRFEQAHRLMRWAIQSRGHQRSEESAKQAAALRVRQEVESLQREAEALRRQHEVEAARSSTLAQALSTLEDMGAIGREITRHLDFEAVFTTLYEHVHGLMDAYSFDVYFVNDARTTRTLVFGMEGGERYPVITLSLDPGHPGHRCIVENQAVLEEFEPNSGGNIPGTADSLSVLYGPMTAGDRLLGIMSIQSPRAHAYGKREVAIFKSLCAYGAIALANAETYQALQQAQASMVQQEKMASLGQLVANVAHEINTPIGAIKSSGQSIAESLVQALDEMPALLLSLSPDEMPAVLELRQLLRRPEPMLSSREERALVRDVASVLEAHGVPDARTRAAILVDCRFTVADLSVLVPLLANPRLDTILRVSHNLALAFNNAANINTAVATVSRIVFALKTYARQGHAEEAVPMSLRESLETVLTLYSSKIKRGTELVCQFDCEGRIQGFPDELSQVWTNLIQNALQAMNFSGTLSVTIARGEGELGGHHVVSIGDTGCGIPSEIQSRIFEPFFTTKPAGEGSGLGLDIVKKIVEKHQGRIGLESVVGEGTTFRVVLPALGGQTG